MSDFPSANNLPAPSGDHFVSLHLACCTSTQWPAGGGVTQASQKHRRLLQITFVVLTFTKFG